MEWVRVLDSAGSIQEGGVVGVVAGERSIALVKVNGEIFALEGVCPHEGGPLAKGTIDNGYLVCPWHGWEFEPSTGQDRYNAARRIKTFSVDLRSDGVYIEI